MELGYPLQVNCFLFQKKNVGPYSNNRLGATKQIPVPELDSKQEQIIETFLTVQIIQYNTTETPLCYVFRLAGGWMVYATRISKFIKILSL